MIPQIIHYCWFGGAPKSPLNMKCIDSWKNLMPNYQLKEWNETNTPLQTAYAREASARGLWSKLSNYIRLQALHKEGGIYLDTDVEVLKDFSPLLDDECFAGFQQKDENSDWVNNAILGARPGHPFLKSCMSLTDEALRETGEFLRSPVVTTSVLKRGGLRDYGLQQVDGVMLYPTEYFYPFPWQGKFTVDCIKEDTYCIH
ncbi:MAG TPA: glycosyltransferase, partial [Pyrinomonadaceae bacterium]|nr:glycosyltransferase [Pyrinomonadaceae bacterium]